MASIRADVTVEREPPAEPPVRPDVVAAHTVLRALADPLRARIVARLAAEQLCTCHLQAELGAKQALVSHHLRELRAAGLVQPEPCGRFTYYRLTPGAFDAARQVLGQLAAAAATDVPKRPC